jgi:hypothetical protein
MESQRSNVRFIAIVCAVSFFFSSLLIARGFSTLRSGEQVVNVTGSARRRIRSDRIIWQVGVKTEAPQLTDAYRQLTSQMPKLRAYLLAHGIRENEITVNAIETTEIRRPFTRSDGADDQNGRIVGYSLRQQVQVASADVDRISAVSRSVTELINQGLLIDSAAPQYLYTRLSDLKVEIMAEAAKDAKARAQQIASATGDKVGAIRSARMGVLQITPADSNQVSAEGINDTSSLEKDITAVVNISFVVR